MTSASHSTNPFPGLRPFESKETHLFFGRDGQNEELLKRLKRNQFLAIVGTSGSGKSSLVRAGLLPALQGGLMASAGSGWRIALLRPGSDPIGNLAESLMAADVLGPKQEDKRDIQIAVAETIMRRSSRGLIELAGRARISCDKDGQPLLPEHENLLVVVDQFEELFRFKQISNAEHPEEAAAFVKLLLEATSQKEEKIFVVLTMRSDFLGHCSQFWDLPEAINEGQYLIPRMTRDERRAAITGPIAVGRGAITEPLVNQLLNDVGDNPDQLPILQHALMRTWDHWGEDRNGGKLIDIPHYKAIGRMAKALSKHADEAYEQLSDSGKKIAARLFKCLTGKEADDKEVRHPMHLGEICKVVKASEDDVKLVIETFRERGRSFLMPPPEVLLTVESLIDISHESLIRNWRRLKKWADQEAESARRYVRLAETALLYKAGGENLLQDAALQVALDWRKENDPNEAWAERYHPAYNEAMRFLDDSKAYREAEIAQREKQQKKEADRDRHALETAQALAEERKRTAEIERQRAEEQRLLAETERERADEQKRLAEEQARSARRLFWLSVAFGVMLLLATVIAVYALTQRRAAINAQKIALDAQKTAEDAREFAEEGLLKQQALTEIASIAQRKADQALEEAVAQAKEAKAQKEKADTERLRAESMKNVGELYRDGFGLYTSDEPEALKEATKKFEEVIRLYGTMDDPASQAAQTSTYLLIGNLLSLSEKDKDPVLPAEPAKPSSAAKYYERALERLDNDWKTKASTLISIGKTYARLSNDTEATKYFDNAIEVYEREAPDQKLSVLSNVADYYHHKRSQSSLAGPYYEKALDILRAKGNREDELSLLRTILAGPLPDDFFSEDSNKYKERFVDLLNDRADFEEKLTTLLELGDIQSTAEEGFKKAGQFYARALLLLRTNNEHPKEKEADVLTKMAGINHELKDYKETIGYYGEAAKIYHDLQKKDEEFETLSTIAEIYLELNTASDAEKYYDQALRIYRDAGSTEKESEQLERIALSFINHEKSAESTKYLERKAEILHRAGEYAPEVEELIRVARTHAELKNGDGVRKFFDRAAQVYRDLNDRPHEVSTLLEIGKLCINLKDEETASRYFDQAVSVYNDAVHRDDRVAVLLAIAQLYQKSDRAQKAIEYNNRAIRIYSDAGERLKEAATLIKVGAAYENRDFFNRNKEILTAIQYYTAARNIFKEFETHKAEEGSTLIKIAEAYADLDKNRGLEYFREAVTALELALPTLQQGADRTRLAEAVYNLAKAYDGLEDKQKALDNYDRALPLLEEIKSTLVGGVVLRIQALASELKQKQ